MTKSVLNIAHKGNIFADSKSKKDNGKEDTPS